MLKTVDDIIEALGGTGAVADLVELGPSAVSMWRTKGQIPAPLYLVIRDALASRRKRAPLSLFGFKELEA